MWIRSYIKTGICYYLLRILSHARSSESVLAPHFSGLLLTDESSDVRRLSYGGESRVSYFALPALPVMPSSNETLFFSRVSPST